jgi:CBS domain-containing protein
MQARDIMTCEVETVAPDDDVSEVLTRLARADFSGFLLVADGAFGVVTETDLVDRFQPPDRVRWIPFPPFPESLTSGIHGTWDGLDGGLDLARNAGKPVSPATTETVVTVQADDDLQRAIDLPASSAWRSGS